MLGRAFKEVFGRPFTATAMMWRHRRTLRYLAGHMRWGQFWNFIFVTYFIRGEDCGKGVLDGFFKLFPGSTPFVWDLEVEVTTRCYGTCIHCEHTYWPDKSYLNQDLGFADFKKLIDGAPRLKWINLTGEGSAFLNKDFPAMIRYCKEKNIYVDFSHDFYQMDEGVFREIIKSGVERIYLSIDGATKETYERVRPSFNFEKVCANVRRFVQMKKELGSPLPELCFRYSFFKDNMEDITKLLPLIHTFGSREELGDDPSVNIVGLLEFDQTRDWVREIPPADVEIVNNQAREFGLTVYWSHPSHDESKKAPLDYCTFWSEPYVMIRGYVLPCCAILMSNKRPFLEKHAFGNLNEQSLKEIWDSRYYTMFREMVTNPFAPVPILCAGCRSFNTKDRINKYGVWSFNQ